VRWLGVDVGAQRKGFHSAILEQCELLPLRDGLTCDEVVALVEEVQPTVVAVDSPCRCAPPGEKTRECERQVRQAICGIRWTPEETAVQSSPYYAWVVEGLKLYDALAGHDLEVIEVFPTASWTRWLGVRGPDTREAWTRRGAATLGLSGVPRRTNQDQRDAIAAALTARQHTLGSTEAIGDIVVPVAGLKMPVRNGARIGIGRSRREVGAD
jgi:predicted nuclease with RNAse H fold